uniref:Uncharacterized protein n=1 Tax=Acrobeloides nanus TaxID=290746 RepID=A0A914EGR3_9BILA
GVMSQTMLSIVLL